MIKSRNMPRLGGWRKGVALAAGFTLMVGLGFSSAAVAQTTALHAPSSNSTTLITPSLRAAPWPPIGGLTHLQGVGFPAGAEVTLDFAGNAPKLGNGSPAPNTVKADSSGVFDLTLQARANLQVGAATGSVGASLTTSGFVSTASSTPRPVVPAIVTPPLAPANRPVVTAAAGVVTASLGSRVLWSLRTSSSVAPVQTSDGVSVVAGGSVILLDAATGVAKARALLPGPVRSLDVNANRVTAVAEPSPGVTERFVLSGGHPLGRVVFTKNSNLLTPLEAEASVGLGSSRPLFPADPNAALAVLGAREARDATNPFTLIFKGAAFERSGGYDAALESYRRALQLNAPFPVVIREAAMLESLRHPDLADVALQLAHSDWAGRGYDPGFAVSQSAMLVWGDPLGTARRLFQANDAVRGAAWLSFLRSTMPRFEGHSRAYQEYAKWLDFQGRGGEAVDWQSFDHELSAGDPFALGEQGLRTVSALALSAGLVLLFAYLALWFALALKYAPAQRDDLAPIGGAWGGWSRAFARRAAHMLALYHSIPEKLVLLTLLALGVGALGLWSYSLRASSALSADALRTGTLGGSAYWSGWAGRQSVLGGSYLDALASQLDGDTVSAEGRYRVLSDEAEAVNNLGAIFAARDEIGAARAAYGRALTLNPDLSAAARNLGLSPAGYRVTFHNSIAPDSPMLAVPEPGDLAGLVVGSPIGEYSRIVANPWSYLNGLPLRISALAMAVLSVFLLILAALGVLALVLPRPRRSRTVAGSLAYNIAALLIPGAALADDVWGLMLLAPWAALLAVVAVSGANTSNLATDLLQPSSVLGLTSAGPVIDLPAITPWAVVGLALVYVINMLVFTWRAVAQRRSRKAT